MKNHPLEIIQSLPTYISPIQAISVYWLIRTIRWSRGEPHGSKLKKTRFCLASHHFTLCRHHDCIKLWPSAYPNCTCLTRKRADHARSDPKRRAKTCSQTSRLQQSTGRIPYRRNFAAGVKIVARRPRNNLAKPWRTASQRPLLSSLPERIRFYQNDIQSRIRRQTTRRRDDRRQLRPNGHPLD